MTEQYGFVIQVKQKLNKNMLKKYIQIFIVIILFLAITQPVSALEVDYPNIGGYTLGPESYLSVYVVYVFVFLVSLVGAVGIIAIVYSGLRILMSFGNPAEIGSARSRILSCVLGIILLLFSYVILNTINPELTIITSTIEPLQPGGVYFRENSSVPPNKYIQAAENVDDTSKINLSLPVELYYHCGGLPSTNVLVWLYSKENMERDGSEITASVECDNFITIGGSVKSFERRYEQPGVYFYQTSNCIGYASDVQKSSRDMTFYYTPHINSVRIVNGLKKDERYGVILTQEGGGGGECTEPIIGGFPGSLGGTSTSPGAPGDSCYEVPKDLFGGDFKSFFAHIIKYNPDYISDGGQVDIDSRNIFARFKPTSSVEPRFDIGSLYIADENTTPHNVRLESLIRDQFEFDNMLYHAGADEDECCIYEGAQNELGWDLGCNAADPIIEAGGTCLQRIDIIGGFYAVLYSNSSGDKGAACQIYTTGKTSNFGRIFDYDRGLYKFVIIPRGG